MLEYVGSASGLAMRTTGARPGPLGAVRVLEPGTRFLHTTFLPLRRGEAVRGSWAPSRPCLPARLWSSRKETGRRSSEILGKYRLLNWFIN